MSIQAIKAFGNKFALDLQALAQGTDKTQTDQYIRIGAIAVRILGIAVLCQGARLTIGGLLATNLLTIAAGALFLTLGHDLARSAHNAHQLYLNAFSDTTSVADGKEKIKLFAKSLWNEAVYEDKNMAVFEGTLIAGQIYAFLKKNLA